MMSNALSRASFATTKTNGRSKGGGNFCVDKDMAIECAYVVVTQNATIRTDQTADTFWTKIRTELIKCGGTAERNWNSLSNRFNNTIQKGEVNKYIGVLQRALRKYHSGLVMDDYVSEARRVFQMQFVGKPFRHEQGVFAVLRCITPKFEVVASQFHHRVASALLISDSDNGGQNEDDVVNNKESDGTIGGFFNEQHEVLDASLCSTTRRSSERLLFELSRPTTDKKKGETCCIYCCLRKEEA